MRCLYGRESTELVSIWFVFQFYFALYLHVLYFYFSFHRLSRRNLYLSPTLLLVHSVVLMSTKISTSCNISSMRRSVSSPVETLRRELKIRRCSGVFLTNFKVFHLVMKHCVECLILLLKQHDFRRQISNTHSTFTSFVFSL